MSKDAYIYDAIRTPRGKGRPGGGLYEVKPIDPVTNLLEEMKCRHNLDTTRIEDVVLATGEPVNEQGQNIAKTALVYSSWDDVTVGAQLHRYRAGGLDAVNTVAMKIMAGMESMGAAGGVESMSRLGIGASGAAAGDPWVAMKSYGISQGQRMLAEGVNPALIENAAAFNGSPMGPLETLDSISLETAHHATEQRKADAEAAGETWKPTPESEVIRIMVEETRRGGQSKGAGFYDYDENGKKVKTWAGLRELFAPEGYVDIPFQDVKDRLLFPQVLEAIRIMEEGVLTSVGDGNIGSIMGIGFPPHTGGVYQCVNAYGVQAFVERAEELAKKYGDSFEPPQLLLQMAAEGATFN